MKPKTKVSVSWLRGGYIAVAAIAMYILVSQVGSLKGSLKQLKAADPHYLWLVFIGTVATFLFSALTYYVIALKPLKYLRTVFVEAGINSLNRLLPAGIGGIGGNYVYLTHSRHTKAQSEAVVAVNTVTGVIANLLLLGILLIYFPARHFKYTSVSSHLVVVGCLIVVIAIIILAIAPSLRKKVTHNLRIVRRNVYQYRFLKRRLFYGLLCQIGLTLGFVLALYFSLRAVHGYLPIGSLMLAYSFAIWLGAVIPAPGGAGTVDAGLVAGLVAFQVDLPTAVAAVLIFRLISFWLPLVLGFGPLIWAYRRGYL